jgi:hypothetical protein
MNIVYVALLSWEAGAYTLGWRMQSEVLALEWRHVDLAQLARVETLRD